MQLSACRVPAGLPGVAQKIIPLISDDETRQILDACKGSSFLDLRDQALVRVYYNTGRVCRRSAACWLPT
jgi:site-specific recombinase XerD